MRDLGWIAFPRNVWEETDEVDENYAPIHTYQVCKVMEQNQNNWLLTSWVSNEGASRKVFTELKFTLRDCISLPGGLGTCKETLNVYYFESDDENGRSIKENQYIKIDTTAADESFTELDLGDRVMKLNTDQRRRPLTRKGFYLASKTLAPALLWFLCVCTVRNALPWCDTWLSSPTPSLEQILHSCWKCEAPVSTTL